MNGIVIQLFCVLIISLGNFFANYSITWPSYALEILESDHSPIGYSISKSDANWIGSLPMLGSLFASVFTSWIADNIGKKNVEVMCGLCLVLSWAILATASNVTLILISRFIVGIGNGIHMVIAIPLVSEIGTDKTRGVLSSLLIFCFTFGALVSYVTGWLLSYQVINYLNLTMCVIFVILISLLKETPAFLIAKGKDEEAIKSLKFYRGQSKTTKDILVELKYLQNQNGLCSGEDDETEKLDGEKGKLQEEKQKDTDTDISAWKTLYTSKPTQRATIICIMNFGLLVLGGTVAVQVYAGPLFARAAPGLSKHMCSIILSIAFALGSMIATFANGWIGRRPMMMSSAFLSSLSLMALSSQLRWSWGPEWMVPAIVLAYCCFFQAGAANVPCVQLGEMFVPKMKNLISTIAVCYMSICNFIVLATFEPIVDCLGLDGTFFMFSIICALTGVITFFTMKETRNCPVEEIQEMYERGILYKSR